MGPYQLIGQLGSGGMGRVFLGRSAAGRLVAVKVIRGDLAADPEFRARFRREVAAARRVSGLFTAVVVDADLATAEPWLATAYVAGPSLAEAVHDHGPLPARSVLALTAGLAESLAAIHDVGVVHRDLKPSNVLLAGDGPRVIDFGISRASEATSVTRAGFVLGSPGFMSPEQALGRDVGPPSDMFSLGAVLAFAATGEPPFGDGLTAALVFRVVYEPPQLDQVPDQIRPLVERCLIKDPSQRPSASELLSEIGAVQPMAGWLPEPVTSGFPESPARADEEPTPPPPPAAEAGEPLAVSPDPTSTLTGPTPLFAVEPEAAPPPPETSRPETSPPETSAPEAETTAPGAATPEAATITPEAMPSAPGPEAEPATAPKLTPEPGGAVVPLPPGDLGGGGRRSRPHRLLVLGSAAAVILIASGATILALNGGSGRASASSSTRPPTSIALATSVATTAAADSATARPSPTVTGTSHSPTASPSGRPNPQPTRSSAIAPARTTAPAPATSSAAPRPTHTTKPAPTHAPPATYRFSVSGASELSCGNEGSVHPSAGASVQFGFVDNSSANVQIDQISSSGAVAYYATLAPGVSYDVGTTVGAYWVVANSGGGCLSVFGINGSGHVTVT